MPTLNWIGKEAVVNHHHQVPSHLLKDVPIWPVVSRATGISSYRATTSLRSRRSFPTMQVR